MLFGKTSTNKRLVCFSARAALLVPLLVFQACSITPNAYKPITVSADVGLQKTVQNLRDELKELSPGDRLYRGMTISDARCNRFFDDLEALRNVTKFSNRRFDALGTGLPSLLQSAAASSLSVSVVSAALGFVSGALTDYDELYLLSQFSSTVFVRWQQAREDASGRIVRLIDSGEVSSEQADWQLYKYSSLCMHSQLTSWVAQSAQAGTLFATNGTTNEQVSTPTSPTVITLEGESREVDTVSVPSYIIATN